MLAHVGEKNFFHFDSQFVVFDLRNGPKTPNSVRAERPGVAAGLESEIRKGYKGKAISSCVAVDERRKASEKVVSRGLVVNRHLLSQMSCSVFPVLGFGWSLLCHCTAEKMGGMTSGCAKPHLREGKDRITPT